MVHFVGNVFIFLGFLFFLLIQRRNIENLLALESHSPDESDSQNNADFKPVSKIWHVLYYVFFLSGCLLRFGAFAT